MSRYRDPKADVVFKKIFGEHPKILISFLNALLPLPGNAPIVSLTSLQEARGIEKGIEKIAINMLKDNEPLDKISRLTGLSQGEIAKLK